MWNGRRTQAICGRKSFCLTPLGWKASQTIRATVLEVEADWARRIGPDRLEQLKTILRDLVASLAR